MKRYGSCQTGASDTGQTISQTGTSDTGQASVFPSRCAEGYKIKKHPPRYAEGNKIRTHPPRYAEGNKIRTHPPRYAGGELKGGAHLILALLLLFTLPQTTLSADSPRKSAKKGIEHYQKAEYDRALAEFMAGSEVVPERQELRYDMGAALYKLEDFQNASAAFGQAVEVNNPKLAADAWYNLGNAMFKAGDLDRAIKAYKNSLYIDHEDKDTKFNLERALMLKQMQQQQQQQGDSTQQQKQEQQQQEQQQQQQAQADSSDNEEEQPQPQQQRETDMTPEEAMQLLQAMENDEQEAQKEKLERQFGKPRRVEKDW